jgi:membrane protease YdiL (CAAX protease family)
MLGMLAALTGIVSLFDLIELLRRAATRPDATFAVVAEIAGLRLPWAMMQILPFAVLLGGILAFWRLTRSSELIVARATGLSAWQFLAGPTLCALALGCFALTALVVAPLFEEVLFRGVLLPVAGQRLGGAGAVVLSAAIFAIAHLSLAELAPLFVLGLGLGWLRWRSGRLGSAVLMHALWNGLTFMNLLFLAD